METPGDRFEETPEVRYARPRSPRGPSAVAVVMLAILFGVVAGFGGALLALWANQQGHLAAYLPQWAAPSTDASPAPIARPVAVAGSTSTFAQIAKQLDQSVVNIDTTSQRAAQMWPFGTGGTQEVVGRGTGVIVDDKGHILTNYHVVGTARKIDVTIMQPGGPKKYAATLVGGDQQNDLAVIKIDARGLKPVRFGNSDLLEPGDPVMAIGNPYGFEHTVSVGVVSATNRPLTVDESVTFYGMIQTDAAINPGNSGGPLVNGNGEVIGINTVLFVGQGSGPQASGIGFAIPSNKVVKVMEQLRKGGKVQHPYIGISYRFIDEDVRRQERLPVKDGVLVLEVYPESPADKAGLRKFDIIMNAEGKALRNRNTLGEIINAKQIGATLEINIKRWDDQGAWGDHALRVKIEAMPPDFLRSMQPRQEQPQEETPKRQERGIPFPWPF